MTSDFIKFLNDNSDGEFSNWSISKDDCKNCYQTVKEVLDDDEQRGEEYHYYEFENSELKQKSKDTNTLYVLHWYVRSPVGFLLYAAPTFEDLERWVRADIGENK